MTPTRDDIEKAHAHLIAARNLMNGVVSQIRSSLSLAAPESLQPRHLVENDLRAFESRIGDGIEELQERLEGRHVD